MAEATTIKTEENKTASKVKAAPKRRTAARKTTARKTTTRKPAARKTTARKTTRKAAARKQETFFDKAQQSGRRVFLASLGVYGKLFDEAEDQLKAARKRAEARRKQADKLYAELIKRGEKLEKEAKKSIDDIELPKEWDKQVEKARGAFDDIKDTLKLNRAA